MFYNLGACFRSMHMVWGVCPVGIKVGVAICLRSYLGTVGSFTDTYIGQAKGIIRVG